MLKIFVGFLKVVGDLIVTGSVTFASLIVAAITSVAGLVITGTTGLTLQTVNGSVVIKAAGVGRNIVMSAAADIIMGCPGSFNAGGGVATNLSGGAMSLITDSGGISVGPATTYTVNAGTAVSVTANLGDATFEAPLGNAIFQGDTVELHAITGGGDAQLRSDSGAVQIIADVGAINMDASAVNVGATAQAVGFMGATAQARSAAIPDAAGGAVIDAEARAALNALLAYFRLNGFVTP